MLKPAWYLPNTDWFAQLPTAPTSSEADQAIISQLARMLSHQPAFGPGSTVAATHVLLLAAEHLGDAMAYAANLHDLTELARLLGGLTIVQAHLIQTLQRIAANIIAGAYAGSGDAPLDFLHAISDSLCTAGANGEVTAGHLKEAHFILDGIAGEPDGR